MRLKNGNKTQILRLTAKMIFLHKMLADILNLHAKIRIIYQMCKKNSRFGKLSSVLLVKEFSVQILYMSEKYTTFAADSIFALQSDGIFYAERR